MAGRHRHHAGGRHARPGRRRPAGWLVAASAITLTGGTLAVVLFSASAPPLPSGDLKPAAAPSASGSVTPRASPVTPRPAKPRDRKPVRSLQRRVDAAARYAREHDLRAGVAVLDLATGRYTGGGDDTELFASASVVKVLIGADLLAGSGGSDVSVDTVSGMIRRSDDDLATRLWPLTGGPATVTIVGRTFGVPDLGTPNTRPGYWGNTHITAHGLVRFYAAMVKRSGVGPVLLTAMRHYAPVASDGTDQDFGLAIAKGRPAIKQGWASASADEPGDATVNTTGIVDGGRYAVAILTEGDQNDSGNDSRGMNAAQRAIVTQMARLLMPDGTIGDGRRRHG